MIEKIDHIGIAVESLTETVPVYRDLLGLDFLGEEEVPDQKVRVAKFAAGDVHIELLEPTAEDSPIAGFLERRGPGIHHIAYGVDDVEKTIEEMQSAGARMIDQSPRTGAGGIKIAFAHPRSTAKVLTEFCEG